MLKVRCVIGPSPIDGYGLFAAEEIKAGQLIAEFDPRFDRVFDDSRVYVLGDYAVTQDFISHFGYLLDHRWWLPFDELRYMNHSTSPNVDSGTHYTKDVALVDIPAGTELTCNYFRFDAAARDKLGLDVDTSTDAG